MFFFIILRFFLEITFIAPNCSVYGFLKLVQIPHCAPTDCARLIRSGLPAFSSQVFCPAQRPPRGAEQEVSAHQHRVLRVLLMTDDRSTVAWPPEGAGPAPPWPGPAPDFRRVKPGITGESVLES